MGNCGSCQREIRICDACGGLMCAPGCADRADDGCTCKKEDDLAGDEGGEA